MLNGRQYLSELTKAEETLLNDNGIVAIFGAYDDIVVMRGAIYDEVHAYEGTTLYFDKNGLLENECNDEECPYFEEKKRSAKQIQALWCVDEEYSWTFETDVGEIPVEAFDILEDNEKYCRGFVFALASL
jgi:hypothetical protein